MSPLKRGPTELTEMVDLTRKEKGKTRARLLDLVPGLSGPVSGGWLQERGEELTASVKVATLDPFQGSLDDVRRRVQQEILGHRGHKDDPLYGIRLALRCGTERQRTVGVGMEVGDLPRGWSATSMSHVSPRV